MLGIPLFRARVWVDGDTQQEQEQGQVEGGSLVECDPMLLA